MHEKPTTQKELHAALVAQGVDVSIHTISRLFNGRIQEPSIYTLHAICKNLHITIDLLLSDEDTYQSTRQYIIHVESQATNPEERERMRKRRHQREQKARDKMKRRKDAKPAR